MENKDLNEVKSLIKVKQNVFQKITMFLKKIFYKNKFKQEPEINAVVSEEDFGTLLIEDELTEEEIYSIFNEEIEEDNEEELISKDEFFQLYEDIKVQKQSIDDLSFSNLVKVHKMLKEEISLATQKIDETNAAEIENELKRLETENRLLIEELKKLENM